MEIKTVGESLGSTRNLLYLLYPDYLKLSNIFCEELDIISEMGSIDEVIILEINLRLLDGNYTNYSKTLIKKGLLYILRIEANILTYKIIEIDI